MLQFSSHTVSHGNATVEVATVTFNGRSFTAGGSVVNETDGLIVGYPVTVKDPKPGEHKYVLQTFDGKVMAPATLVSRWKQRGFGGVRFDVYAWRIKYNDRWYSGRNAGDGMLLRLRRSK